MLNFMQNIINRIISVPYLAIENAITASLKCRNKIKNPADIARHFQSRSVNNLITQNILLISEQNISWRYHYCLNYLSLTRK